MPAPAPSYTSNESYILLSSQLPLVLSPDEVIYTEDGHDEATNAFIQRNYGKIAECFASHGYQFIYLPWINEQLTASEQLMRYRQPVGPLPEPTPAPWPSSWLLDWMANPHHRSLVATPAFVTVQSRPLPWTRYNPQLDPQVLARVSFHVDECDDVETFINFFIKRLRGLQRPRVHYSLVVEKEADANFSENTHVTKLLDEVKERLRKLRAYGLSEYFLRMNLFEPPQLSRLTITAKHQIFLTDYNNLEIKMTPLVKAVFFLFLRHPEGILFKHLPDYRDELAMIYECIKERRKLERDVVPRKHYDKKILSLTDPLDNSINEKCARIKEAFLVHIHEFTAASYYVNGPRGEAKRITLPRDLLHWPPA